MIVKFQYICCNGMLLYYQQYVFGLMDAWRCLSMYVYMHTFFIIYISFSVLSPCLYSLLCMKLPFRVSVSSVHASQLGRLLVLPIVPSLFYLVLAILPVVHSSWFWLLLLFFKYFALMDVSDSNIYLIKFQSAVQDLKKQLQPPSIQVIIRCICHCF